MFNPDYRQNVDNFVKGRLEIFHDTWYDDVSVKKHFAPDLISADCYAASQFPQSWLQ